MKRLNRIFFISISLIVIVTGGILYKIKTYKSVNPGCAILNTPQAFCGTQNLNLTENQKQGRNIFNSNCAACHKLDRKSTGPALREVDSLVYMKWLYNKNQKIDSSKIEKLGIEYHRAIFSNRLSQQEKVFLIRYLSN